MWFLEAKLRRSRQWYPKQQTTKPSLLKNRKKKLMNASTGPIAANCLVCGEEFASKSKLFAHINSTGHAALKENTKMSKRKK
ncbi:hypothetical protein M3Y94_01134800 [Aphelenchoides besseyi]|nr:hypothetical protein M3Y94_01134800 [Aphelenchoides besseyi]